MRQNKKISELTVITRGKELCAYVMTVTQKSPKQFRFSYVARMQNLALDIIENLFRANDTFVNSPQRLQIRLQYQRSARTDIKLLAYMAMLAMEHKCLLPKQYEQIARIGSECGDLLAAWVASDKKRFGESF